jgi:NAD(P)H-flavin reductase
MWNGGKAKAPRKIHFCKVLKKENPEKNVVIFTLLASHKMVQDLQHPGSYVFIRHPQTTQFYDAPISIMDTNLEENWIKVAIEIKGIKTKSIDKINEGETMLIRAPFWNGIFGLKNVYDSKDGTSIVVARGIGQAPMIPVLKKLYSNGNKIITIIDKGGYGDIFVKEYLQQYNCEVHEINTLEKGELPEDLKKLLNNLIETEKVNLVHCDGADILNLKVTEYLKNKVKISCCNNARMCCGEGVCGSCSARFKGRVVKRLCKIQIDPKSLFEGRRFI